MDVVIDASTALARQGAVAVWSFDVRAWGESAQASDEATALSKFARRVGLEPCELTVTERITGPRGVFAADSLPAADAQIAQTIQILNAQRAQTLALLDTASEEALDARDASVKQPRWMMWRTPRMILHHIADTESRTYPGWCGLPQLGPVDDVRAELDASAEHIQRVLAQMPRAFEAEHRRAVWTPVKLLRRLAWHERIELIFLRRRLPQV